MTIDTYHLLTNLSLDNLHKKMSNAPKGKNSVLIPSANINDPDSQVQKVHEFISSKNEAGQQKGTADRVNKDKNVIHLQTNSPEAADAFVLLLKNRGLLSKSIIKLGQYDAPCLFWIVII